MSNKKTQKAKRKAKQEFLKSQKILNAELDAADEEEQPDDDIDDTFFEETALGQTINEAITYTLKNAQQGKDVDERLVYLFKDYRRYRLIVIALAVIAFGILVASMGLYRTGYIAEDQQNFMIIFANFVAVALLIIVFARVSPIKTDIIAWKNQRDDALRQAYEARLSNRRGAAQKDFESIDMDKFFTKRNRRARNKRVPPTPQYRRVRIVWFILIVTAGILMLAALLIAHKDLQNITMPISILVVSYVLLFIAMFIERRKMKPLREAYAEQQERALRKEEKKQRKGKRR